MRFVKEQSSWTAESLNRIRKWLNMPISRETCTNFLSAISYDFMQRICPLATTTECRNRTRKSVAHSGSLESSIKYHSSRYNWRVWKLEEYKTYTIAVCRSNLSQKSMGFLPNLCYQQIYKQKKEHEFEAIRYSKKIRGTQNFLVNWKGYRNH